MKPEVSERLFIEELFKQSAKKTPELDQKIKNIERLTGDASTRRYYRVFCENESYVVCLDNPSESENNFVKVQRYLKDKSLRVPGILDLDISKGYILEEDLGDVTLLQHISTIGCASEELDIYKKIIDQLLTLHRIENNEKKALEVFELKFDYEKLKFEIDFSIKYFLRKFLKNKDKDYLQQLSLDFDPICERLSSQKMVLTHRDFHSRNIMVKNEDLILIDFQDARWGIPQYDLASLLDDCYYEISSENKEKLMRYYFDNLESTIHSQGSYVEFKSLYRDMAIQRVFKAIGSFTYIYDQRKDERYLKYIGFAMEKLRVYMLEDEKYSNLRKQLFRTYYES